MSNHEQLDMFITYMFDNNPKVSYPHILKIETKNQAQIAMVRTEFNALCQLVRTNCYPADYLIDQPWFTVDFRNKADAMRIKLLWKPIEWINISSTGF